MLLPWFGGAASVWITCMLFFQLLLLGRYIYAHWLINNLKPSRQISTHVALLALSILVLPIAPNRHLMSGQSDPSLHLLLLLLTSVGAPYFLLSTTTPLLQSWFSKSYQQAMPYRLFALSNFASLLGLLAYPLIVEPKLTLSQQSNGCSGCIYRFCRSLHRHGALQPQGPAHCASPVGHDSWGYGRRTLSTRNFRKNPMVTASNMFFGFAARNNELLDLEPRVNPVSLDSATEPLSAQLHPLLRPQRLVSQDVVCMDNRGRPGRHILCPSDMAPEEQYSDHDSALLRRALRRLHVLSWRTGNEKAGAAISDFFLPDDLDRRRIRRSPVRYCRAECASRAVRTRACIMLLRGHAVCG